MPSIGATHVVHDPTSARAQFRYRVGIALFRERDNRVDRVPAWPWRSPAGIVPAIFSNSASIPRARSARPASYRTARGSAYGRDSGGIAESGFALKRALHDGYGARVVAEEPRVDHRGIRCEAERAIRESALLREASRRHRRGAALRARWPRVAATAFSTPIFAPIKSSIAGLAAETESAYAAATSYAVRLQRKFT